MCPGRPHFTLHRHIRVVAEIGLARAEAERFFAVLRVVVAPPPVSLQLLPLRRRESDCSAVGRQLDQIMPTLVHSSGSGRLCWVQLAAIRGAKLTSRARQFACLVAYQASAPRAHCMCTLQQARRQPAFGLVGAHADGALRGSCWRASFLDLSAGRTLRCFALTATHAAFRTALLPQPGLSRRAVCKHVRELSLSF